VVHPYASGTNAADLYSKKDETSTIGNLNLGQKATKTKLSPFNPGPSPGFSSRGAKNQKQKGGILSKYTIRCMHYAATGGPNVKSEMGGH